MKPELELYVNMQKQLYCEYLADKDMDICKSYVGPPESFAQNDNLYHVMFGNEDHRNHVALDFGCGVGRLMVWFHKKFWHITGVDLSPAMLEKCRIYLKEHDIVKYNLVQNNGYSLGSVDSNIYDVVYSAWVLEHFCVHELRDIFFREFYRVLKPRGQISIMMQGGDKYLVNSPSHHWYDNYYSAPSTNSTHDVRIENLFEVTRDLNQIGFYNTTYLIVPRQDIYKYSPPIFAGHQYTIIIKATK